MFSATTLFEWLDNAYNTVVQAPLLAVVPNVLSANAALVSTALSIYVVMYGMLLMYRQVPMADLARACGIAAGIGFIYTAANYNLYIVQEFTVTIPQWISTSLSSNHAFTPAQQLDQLASALALIAANAIDKASPITEIAQIGIIGFLLITTLLVIGTVFAFTKFAAFLAAILVVLGPFVIWLALFPITRSIAENWFRQLVGIMVKMAALTIMASVCITAMDSFEAQFVTSGSIDVVMYGLLQNLVVDFVCLIGVAVIPGVVRDIVGGGTHGLAALGAASAIGAVTARGMRAMGAAAGRTPRFSTAEEEDD